MICNRTVRIGLAILLAPVALFVALSAADFGGDGQKTPLEVPLIVVLWEHKDFSGLKRVFIRDEPNLGEGWTKGATFKPGAKFEGASSVGVHPGPDYEKWKARNGGQEPTVTLWTKPDYDRENGVYFLQLQAGGYPNLVDYDMNDKARSLRFEPAGSATISLKKPAFPVAPISSIPIVVRLHTAGRAQALFGGEADNVMTLVESSSNILTQYGSAFNDGVTWIEVLKGPNWMPTSRAEFRRDARTTGPVDRTSAAPADLDLSGTNFNDKLSAVKIIK